jgi:hypothetical protein
MHARIFTAAGSRPGIRCTTGSLLVAAAVLVLGCAGGKPGQSGRPDGGGFDVGARDRGLEAYIWPDVWPDQTITTWDTGSDIAVDAGVTWDVWAPDTTPPTPDTGPPSCPDSHEPNQSCFAASDLGSIKEGSSWKSSKGTASPSSDVDWYKGEGQEGSHTCLPFTSQDYYLKVRITVPTGRKLRVCLYKGSCTAAPTCQTNTTAGTQLEVKYKVSGTCAFNDDTTAYFKVEPVDGEGGCTNYTVAFNYND